MQWNIDDLPIFIAVVDQKGISAAAISLGISKSAVSKSLSRLETALGVRLLERNSRNIRITSEGEAFYRQGKLVMEQVNEATTLMSGLTAKPNGRLIVALPMAFAREIVAPKLTQFRRAYPDIALEIVVTSHPVDIIRDQIDIAVVIGELSDSELIVRTLYASRLTCVASPAYAASHHLGANIHSTDVNGSDIARTEFQSSANKDSNYQSSDIQSSDNQSSENLSPENQSPKNKSFDNKNSNITNAGLPGSLLPSNLLNNSPSNSLSSSPSNSPNNLASELQSHIHLIETRYATNRFPVRVDGQKKYLDLKSKTIQVNDPITVREAVINGCGVALVPNQYCKKQLASGELIQVFADIEFELSASVVSVIYPSRRLISNKTRAFLEFLVEICDQI